MRSDWVILLRRARPRSGEMVLLLLLMLAGTAIDVLKPWPMKLIVDQVLSGQPLPRQAAWLSLLPGSARPENLLGWMAFATVLLFTAGQFLAALQAYVQTGVGTRLSYRLGGVLFDHLQRLTPNYHSRQQVGDLVRRVTTDGQCIRELLLGAVLPVLAAVISLSAMFAIMWRLDRTLSLLALFVVPILGLLIKLFDRPMTERTYQHQQLEGEMMALAEQTLTALPVVQAFAREDHEDRRFHGLSRRTLQAYLRAILAQTQFGVGVGAATALGTAVMMAVGGFQVAAGELTLGSLLVFLSYLASLYAPLETIAYLTSTYTSAKAKARRVAAVLGADDAVQECPTAIAVPEAIGHQGVAITFEDVGFGYEPDKPILSEITLDVCPGETIALVGSTGAGKSTLVSLIPRFFDPWQGRVMFNGLDIRQFKLADLRARIALVLQEPFLLPLTVAENIAYGRPQARREEIIAAAVMAQADEFIRRLPLGYDTVIGERGATLSGGQKQRLGIARALLKDAPVLILDEPTAALDTQTEALLLQALERLMVGRTTFIIAHRLSTIRRADRIVVLEKGRMVETGNHETLLAARGAYAHLHSLQWESPVGSARGSNL
ncbi:MAG: ABC transporter ATP-binding protein [Candidatus Competibacteraceae bacterium]